jgi:hypothetical protein
MVSTGGKPNKEVDWIYTTQKRYRQIHHCKVGGPQYTGRMLLSLSNTWPQFYPGRISRLYARLQVMSKSHLLSVLAALAGLSHALLSVFVYPLCLLCLPRDRAVHSEGARR